MTTGTTCSFGINKSRACWSEIRHSEVLGDPPAESVRSCRNCSLQILLTQTRRSPGCTAPRSCRPVYWATPTAATACPSVPGPSSLTTPPAATRRASVTRRATTGGRPDLGHQSVHIGSVNRPGGSRRPSARSEGLRCNDDARGQRDGSQRRVGREKPNCRRRGVPAVRGDGEWPKTTDLRRHFADSSAKRLTCRP